MLQGAAGSALGLTEAPGRVKEGMSGWLSSEWAFTAADTGPNTTRSLAALWERARGKSPLQAAPAAAAAEPEDSSCAAAAAAHPPGVLLEQSTWTPCLRCPLPRKSSGREETRGTGTDEKETACEEAGSGARRLQRLASAVPFAPSSADASGPGTGEPSAAGVGTAGSGTAGPSGGTNSGDRGRLTIGPRKLHGLTAGSSGAGGEYSATIGSAGTDSAGAGSVVASRWGSRAASSRSEEWGRLEPLDGALRLNAAASSGSLSVLAASLLLPLRAKAPSATALAPRAQHGAGEGAGIPRE
ncbi:unnamed protein product [Closterium sp. NIES-64]|nr:unnamed protein product [Closterium sp. NIES-64]